MARRPGETSDAPTSADDEAAPLRAEVGVIDTAADPVAPAPVFAALRRACRGLGRDGTGPWRFVHVTADDAHAAITWNLEVCNTDALLRARANHPRRHDLAVVRNAPVQLAAFADPAHRADGAPDGHSAGDPAVATTAAAIARFRLCAGAADLAVRWITALDAAALAHALDVSASWRFVGYLCVGRPAAGTSTQGDRAPAGDPLAGCLLVR